MDRIIQAAVAKGIAIEINARFRIPSATFIQRAKLFGVKFTFGTNNENANLGRLEYCLDMIQVCGLTPEDIFIPWREH
jgi:histidinol phosphatase-like PHP family hydrolase